MDYKLTEQKQKHILRIKNQLGNIDAEMERLKNEKVVLSGALSGASFMIAYQQGFDHATTKQIAFNDDCSIMTIDEKKGDI